MRKFLVKQKLPYWVQSNMGVKNTVLSAQTMKGATVSATMSALANENAEAIKCDPKNTKKQK